MRKSDRRPESLDGSMNFKEGYSPEGILRQSRATGGALRSKESTGGRPAAKKGCHMTGVSAKSDLYGGERKKKSPRGSTLSGDTRHRQAVKNGGDVKREHRSWGDVLQTGASMLPLAAMFLKKGGKATRRSHHEMGDMVATDGSPTAMKRGGHPKKRQKHAAGAVAKIRKDEY